MFTIIKRKKKFQFDNSELASIDVVYDGIFVKFDDQTELKFNMSVKNGLSQVLGVASRCKGDVTVNIDQAEIGNLSKVVTIGNSNLLNTPKVETEKKPEVVQKEPLTEESVSKSLLNLFK